MTRLAAVIPGYKISVYMNEDGRGFRYVDVAYHPTEKAATDHFNRIVSTHGNRPNPPRMVKVGQ